MHDYPSATYLASSTLHTLHTMCETAIHMTLRCEPLNSWENNLAKCGATPPLIVLQH